MVFSHRFCRPAAADLDERARDGAIGFKVVAFDHCAVVACHRTGIDANCKTGVMVAAADLGTNTLVFDTRSRDRLEKVRIESACRDVGANPHPVIARRNFVLLKPRRARIVHTVADHIAPMEVTRRVFVKCQKARISSAWDVERDPRHRLPSGEVIPTHHEVVRDITLDVIRDLKAVARSELNDLVVRKLGVLRHRIPQHDRACRRDVALLESDVLDDRVSACCRHRPALAVSPHRCIGVGDKDGSAALSHERLRGALAAHLPGVAAVLVERRGRWRLKARHDLGRARRAVQVSARCVSDVDGSLHWRRQVERCGVVKLRGARDVVGALGIGEEAEQVYVC